MTLPSLRHRPPSPPAGWIGLGWIPLAIALCATHGGCGNGSAALVTENQRLRDELAAQSLENQQLRDQLLQQSEQVRRLSGLSAERRLELVPHVDRIELASLSGGYDDDRDGADDGIVLYLRPIDAAGDVIKGAGSVHVRLLDLAEVPADQLLAELHVAPEDLGPLWFGVITAHYTLRLPWDVQRGRPRHAAVTAVISFVDYLTGRSCDLQRVFTIRGIAGGTPPIPSAQP